MNRTMYMHTLDGRPAFFDGEVVCFAGGRTRARLVSSLAQIRREQRASRQVREKPWGTPWKYGYVLVEVGREEDSRG